MAVLEYERFLLNRRLKDFNPIVVGAEQCEPLHAYGPTTRWYTLIHFVTSGKGIFRKGDMEYTVEAGEAFIILPEEVTYYQADETDPWRYCWVGFDGALSARFSELPPVICVGADSVERLFPEEIKTDLNEYEIAACLLRFYSELFAERKATNHYVRQLKNYIKASYMEPLRVERIAEQMHLNRRYLSRLFKTETGYTPQDFIIKVRMEAALHFLEKGYTVAEVAAFCGYEDVSNFTKLFKKRWSCSPSAWKNEKNGSKGAK